jgi:hypothetical protein
MRREHERPKRVTRRISRAPYLAVALPLLLIACALLWMLSPTIGEWVTIERDMPRYEVQFGFKGGWITYATGAGHTTEAYGIAWLDPNGRLARLGFREGDIPVAHHGDGVGWFRWTLDQAIAGKRAELWVSNPKVGLGASGRRKIVIEGEQEPDDESVARRPTKG